MALKRIIWLVCALLCLPFCAMAQEGAGRALLIGVDEFVTRPSAYPSSTNNVYAMQALFQSAARPLEALILPQEPVTDADTLRQLIQSTFAGAGEYDTSYLYISTHGEYDPASGRTASRDA